MSKTMQPIYLTAFVFVFAAVFVSPIRASDLSVKIVLNDSVAAVSGSFREPQKFLTQRNLSFVRTIAGVAAPPDRIADLSLFDAAGRKVDCRRLSDGEYLAAAPFAAWTYERELKSAPNINAKAHFSWVEGKSGILMLRDLLPEFAAGTGAKVELIVDSQIATTAKSVGGNVFETTDVGNSIFYLDSGAVRKVVTAGSSRITVMSIGQWQTDTADAASAVDEIFSYYEKTYGPRPTNEAIVFLGKFPDGTPVGRWAAETRESNITIFSSEMNFKTQSVQKLHEQLRHEIFHLWFPNSLNLSGNYDWFYEGFALYWSLKTAVAMNRIRFDDYLDTLSRASAIETASRRRLSLIEASINRWNGANTQIYARGMIVAFLIDAAVLNKTKGRESLDTILVGLYRKHGLAMPRTDANTAILNFLTGRDELRAIVENYIKSPAIIDWTTEILPLGIATSGSDGSTKLRVSSKLDRRQKDLLDKLGYNNWRKKVLTIK